MLRRTPAAASARQRTRLALLQAKRRAARSSCSRTVSRRKQSRSSAHKHYIPGPVTHYILPNLFNRNRGVISSNKAPPEDTAPTTAMAKKAYLLHMTEKNSRLRTHLVSKAAVMLEWCSFESRKLPRFRSPPKEDRETTRSSSSWPPHEVHSAVWSRRPRGEGVGGGRGAGGDTLADRGRDSSS